MTLKKLMALGCAAALSVAVLSGCGPEEVEEPTEPSTEAVTELVTEEAVTEEVTEEVSEVATVDVAE